MERKHNQIMKEEIVTMLKAGIIVPSTSNRSFSVVIASKNDGKPRFCVDYRTLNDISTSKQWPLHEI